MKLPSNDHLIAAAGAIVGLGAWLWLWLQTPWAPLWPLLAAFAAGAAAVVVWTGVLPGQARDGAWALLSSVLVAEAVWEYSALPTGAWLWQTAAWVPVLCAAAGAGMRRGWTSGLRVGLGAAFLANAGLAVVFGNWLGQPVQATVLEGSGAFERFEASQSTDFLVWSVGDFWTGTLVRLVTGAVLGAAFGLAGQFVARRTTRA